MITKYENWLIENGKSKNTIQTYTINIKQYIKWHLETFGVEPTELRHVNVFDYRSYLQNVKNNAANTVNTKLAALISLNEFLITSGKQKDIVVTKNDLLRLQAAYANPSDVSEIEIDALRQAVLEASGVMDYALVTIMAYVGLRINETVSLSPEDIDCVGKQITVCRGKGNKERIVYIGDKVINAVKEYLKEFNFGGRWLFPGRGGKHLHRSVVNKIFNKHSDKITPHKCRHYYCSTALEKGYSYHELAYKAGHSNIHSSLRYSHLKQDAMKEKANKL